MKSEFLDFRGDHGEIRLVPETLDDLWHLGHLIRPGDLVFATTLRSMEAVTDRVRPEKAEKRPVRLGIRAEKVDFQSYAARLRIGGVIQFGVDVGSYHTVNLEAGQEISVIKTWTRQDRERIERAVKASVFGVVHILTLEEGAAELYRIRQYGPEEVAEVTMGSGKGGGAYQRQEFFDTIRRWLAEVTGPIVLAGPGFVKEDFLKYLRDAGDPVVDRIRVVDTRRTGRGGVQDVIGQGALERLSGDLQLQREVQAMEELLMRISCGRPAAYGRAEVREATSYGAVQQILVVDDLLRDPGIRTLIEESERTGARVVILSSAFDPGRRLTALGGIAALLRFPIA
ncbi:MAG: mRNA surveillance protein pelota [Methanomicrobiales archaeon]|nr:mRNA surveillance protein pelota [Methanomicrobiales archaeon]MDI6877317.1 mRNA surveillance protein pelota [Methanomicrobiales archaeon]